ncbi:distal membrane-arm assembly complex protein 2-like [Ruditapes philippinarum]|uniref:distal membrane-arm assembly complex protein 2-like n=1 Tax=Ruditapes philippinarum TaxID=129788 RepID=UPI00295BE2AC|nr:distal membrane-arm assembly complex protein 2-like [Ruditapes philippinarum]
MFLKLGGKVKFVDDDVWYQKFEHQPSPLPTTYEEGYKVEAVDVSNIVFLHEGLQYFYELEHVKFIRLSKSKYVDDWYIETIIQTCPNLEALDISDCPQITDNGLEILYRLKNLKVVNITNCHKIKCSEAICAQLYDLLPDLNVIGLDSLTNVTGSDDLLEYEMNTSRYMSWGSFLNQKLDLSNEINIDEFMVSQMKKLGIEIDSDKDNASAGKQDVTEAHKDSHVDSDLKHSTVGSVNT